MVLCFLLIGSCISGQAGRSDSTVPADLPFEMPVIKSPQFRKIYCKNIICKGAAGAVLLQGLPEMPIREI